MKAASKVVEVIVTLCLVAAVAGFWMLAGDSFQQMRAGAVPLEIYLHSESEKTLQDAEGVYVTYDAMYPVSYYVEEYYGGDADRERTLGYPVYDEENGIVLYVTVNERHDGQLIYRLAKLRVPREDWGDMEPIHLSGTLEVMDDETIRHALEALEDTRNSVSVRIDGLDDLAQAQTEWYMIRAGIVGDLKPEQIIGCILAAGLCLLILVYRVVAFLLRAIIRKPKPMPDTRMEQFLQEQCRAWIRDWCEDYDFYTRKIAYGLVLILTVVACGVGLFAGYPLKDVIATHLALSVILGEAVGVLAWVCTHWGAKQERLVKKIRDGIERQIPNPAIREAFAEEMRSVGKEWRYLNVRKRFSVYTMSVILLGDRCWCRMSANGQVTVIDAQRLHVVKNANSGNGDAWAFGLWYQQMQEKSKPDELFMIWGDDAAGELMYLMKKKADDRVKFISA